MNCDEIKKERYPSQLSSNQKKTVAISSLLVEEYEKSENADVSVSDKLPGCLALSTLAKETGH